ncbi:MULTISPECIES: contact-dependent growth inhibition system immunity protein [unclassified Paenibacillus]|uniref:contact-dependent growth inhibition system immunity protein n=1 Tax=unclassified Paenibacillus TaxID=185978 RepID=UPI0030F79032
MNENLSELTINEISKLEGFTEDFEVDEDVPLSVWYNSIQKKKIKNLNHGDIAKLIRQTMHLQYIIPEALNRLRINPLVGYLGDGEIMEAIAQVNENEWDENSIVTSMLSSFVEEFLCLLKNNELNFPEDKEVYSDQEREEYYQLLLKIKNTLQKSKH